MRKRSIEYYTVEYKKDDGTSYHVGRAYTRIEIMMDIIINTSKYPIGFGKVIITREY